VLVPSQLISRRIFGVLTIVAIALAGLLGWTTFRERNTALSNATMVSTNLAQTLSQHAARTFESVDLILRLAVNRLEGSNRRIATLLELYPLLKELDEQAPQIRALLVTDETGRTVLDSRGLSSRTIDFSERMQFQAHQGSPDVGLYIAPPVNNPATGRMSIYISRRFNDPAGRFAGIVAAALDLDYLSDFYGKIDVGPQGAIMLQRSDGMVLVPKPYDESLIGRDIADGMSFKNHLREAPAGHYEALSTTDGITRLISYERVETLPLVMTVALGKDDVLHGWRHDALRNGLVGAGIIAVLGALAFLLATAIQRREEAEIEAEAAAGQLARKNAALDAVLQQMPDGVRLVNDDLRLVAWNDRLFEVLDVDRDAVLRTGDPHRTILSVLAERGEFGKGRIDDLVAQREAMIRADQTMVYRHQSVDGRWTEYRGTRTPDGGYLTVLRDITAEVTREIQIADAYERLEAQATDLVSAAEDLNRARRAAEAARMSAQEANRTKSEFLTGMSHELRTPLNSILGFSEIIRSIDLGVDAATLHRVYAGHIHAAGEHLLSLLDDLFDLAKVETGQLELREEVVELGEILRSVLIMMRERAHEGRIALQIDTDRPPVVIRADALKLKQSLINLIGNGIKFTPQGGSIRVWPEITSDGVEIAVEDTGIGIKPEDLPRVFDRFAQIGSGETPTIRGTGLGMPLTKTLVELHGGSVLLESKVGRGTKVTLRLPSTRLVH
jgi:signal transduction histidine kinase